MTRFFAAAVAAALLCATAAIAAAPSTPVDLAGTEIWQSQSTAVCGTDTGSCGGLPLLKRINQTLTAAEASINALGTPCVYHASPPTLTESQTSACQVDANGYLRVVVMGTMNYAPSPSGNSQDALAAKGMISSDGSTSCLSAKTVVANFFGAWGIAPAGAVVVVIDTSSAVMTSPTTLIAEPPGTNAAGYLMSTVVPSSGNWSLPASGLALTFPYYAANGIMVCVTSSPITYTTWGGGGPIAINVVSE